MIRKQLRSYLIRNNCKMVSLSYASFQTYWMPHKIIISSSTFNLFMKTVEYEVNNVARINYWECWTEIVIGTPSKLHFIISLVQDVNIEELRKYNKMHCCKCWIKEKYAKTYKYVFSLIPNQVNESCITNKNILEQNAFIN